MTTDAQLREQLVRVLDWEDAHAGFDAAVADIPEHVRGSRIAGLHSPWQLLEHLRRTQRDILEFCREGNYQELEWPEDYWPPTSEPPSAAAWDESIAAFRNDRSALQRLAVDPEVDPGAGVPHGTGQTYLRELLLAADHTSYHVGQLIVVRQLLGVWK